MLIEWSFYVRCRMTSNASSRALNRAKQRRVEEVMKMAEEVSKLSSQNQLLATRLGSLIHKTGRAVEENKLLRKMLLRASEMPAVMKVHLHHRHFTRCVYRSRLKNF